MEFHSYDDANATSCFELYTEVTVVSNIEGMPYIHCSIEGRRCGCVLGVCMCGSGGGGERGCILYVTLPMKG